MLASLAVGLGSIGAAGLKPEPATGLEARHVPKRAAKAEGRPLLAHEQPPDELDDGTAALLVQLESIKAIEDVVDHILLDAEFGSHTTEQPRIEQLVFYERDLKLRRRHEFARFALPKARENQLGPGTTSWCGR